MIDGFDPVILPSIHYDLLRKSSANYVKLSR
jgi:hypothetical protein